MLSIFSYPVGQFYKWGPWVLVQILEQCSYYKIFLTQVALFWSSHASHGLNQQT